MTDTVPAAATGLPSFDRRSFLSTLIAAGVLSAGTELPAAAAAGHPDAELLELGALMDAAQARCAAFETLQEDAYNHDYETPEIPEGVRWRPSDFPMICIDRDRRLTHVQDEIWTYENLEIEKLREQLPNLKATQIRNGGWGIPDETIARVEEILAASEAWNAEIKAAEDRAGITEAFAGILREEAVVDELQFRIASLPALTVDGLRVKARAAAISFSDDDEWLQREYLPKLLAKWSNADGHRGRFDILALSLVVDALMLGTGAKVAPSDERAVA